MDPGAELTLHEGRNKRLGASRPWKGQNTGSGKQIGYTRSDLNNMLILHSLDYRRRNQKRRRKSRRSSTLYIDLCSILRAFQRTYTDAAILI